MQDASEEEAWIVKPASSACGRGIYITKNFADLPPGNKTNKILSTRGRHFLQEFNVAVTPSSLVLPASDDSVHTARHWRRRAGHCRLCSASCRTARFCCGVAAPLPLSAAKKKGDNALGTWEVCNKAARERREAARPATLPLACRQPYTATRTKRYRPSCRGDRWLRVRTGVLRRCSASRRPREASSSYDMP